VPDTNNAVVLRPHPFSADHGVVHVQGGHTLQAMLHQLAQGAEIADTVRVDVGGVEVPRSMWARIRPKAGAAVHVTRMPAGSNGGKWLRAVLMIVVMAVAMWATAGGAAGLLGSGFGAGTTGAMLLGAGAYMVGALRVPALLPENTA